MEMEKKTSYEIREELSRLGLCATGEWDYGRKEWISKDSLLTELKSCILDGYNVNLGFDLDRFKEIMEKIERKES